MNPGEERGGARRRRTVSASDVSWLCKRIHEPVALERRCGSGKGEGEQRGRTAESVWTGRFETAVSKWQGELPVRR